MVSVPFSASTGTYLELSSVGERNCDSLLFSSEIPNFRMTEPPFRPREKLIEKQKYFQNIQKHTYLKGPFDRVTSVAIPMALAASSIFLIGRGIYNMSHGIGKKE